MKLLVDRLTDSPTELHYEATPAWWRERCAPGDERLRCIDAPLRIDLRAHRMGADLYLEGEVQGSLALTCGRCLERYRSPVREPFRLVLEPAGSRVPADPEGAEQLARHGLFLADELEAGWFRGSEVELESFFLERVALLLPVQPVCREECRGLCARCGADRNRTPCECEDVRPESPFAVLRQLREGPGAPTGGESR